MLSTHIMQEVEAVCSRAIIINKGKIVADDLTENLHLLLINKNIVTVEFNDAVTAALLKQISGIVHAQHRKGNIWELHSNNKDDVRSNIFNFAVQNKLTVLSMNKEDNSMEDVFHQLTKE
jgi:ABC-2 type transport system ATP-binding protein